jgi:hypothetical protein
MFFGWQRWQIGHSRLQGCLLNPGHLCHHQWFVDLVGSVLLVLGQQQFGTALGDAWPLTGGLVTQAGLSFAVCVCYVM